MTRLSDPAYDVIIAGASFAGLAAARRLRGRVLLLDRQPIGAGVTSACAAPRRIVAMMGAEGSVRQEHHALVIHTPGASVPWPLPESFVTFDYDRFCRDAAAGAGVRDANGERRAGGVEFRQASVLGRDGRRVLTTAGAFDARVLIDATGPRAALAGAGRPRRAAFGIESEVPVRVPPGLHFYFVPEIRDGYAWAFPCGQATRFGVLSYRGRSRLLPVLERFMARFDARPHRVHGGFLATGWTPHAAGDLLATGDAAGHCLPLSGEGIRTAVLAGSRCGDLAQAVLDGRLSLEQARSAYRAFIAADRTRYRALLWGNLLALVLPQRWLGRASALLARAAILRWFFGHYLGIMQSAAARHSESTAVDLGPLGGWRDA